MNTNLTNPPVVKEFRFYPSSKIVTVVFGDDTTEDFTGGENFHAAFSAAHHAPNTGTAISLTGESGKTVALNVPQGTPHETFDA